MQALKVTFKLRSLVVQENDYPIHLDGLLAACVSEEAQEFGSNAPWQDADDLSHLLERTDDDDTGAWVWKASCLQFKPASERFFTTLVRRSEPEAFMQAMDSKLLNGRPRNSLSAKSGHNRGYFLLHSYQWMESATAWCIGDPVEIQSALQRVRYIGKHGRNGFGMLESFLVETSQEQHAWKRRFMPNHMEGENGISYIQATRRLRAPYWKKTGKIAAKVPVLV
ncbi:hypothetical protein D5039_21660 [Verminephrobacter aporrectodeae subsp. tuberculatae]|uniref:Uncharacterized protein n=1 Tax=Verminephrobacter aporrectodeae subsp. tuberculatae TaxID=1110392 RepID=A0ABT3KZ85_9BURK|nr:type IV CRISPR-associated protein Csf3 [Verminephrobacter aporrectodeae]MCW5323653.1 hypothetical protein [Verminephrobacter aporrectodeae subsp. tuberculatae]